MYVDSLPLHYVALGVAEDASVAEIRTAWHRLARLDHPDHQGAGVDVSAARFTDASAAWGVLRHKESRAAYDRQLAESRTVRCVVCNAVSPEGPVCSLCALAAAPTRAPVRPNPPRAPKPARPAEPVRPGAATSPPPMPKESAKNKARREAYEEDMINQTRTWDDINDVHAPSGDSLLEALLTDAAIRSSTPTRKPAKRKSRLEVVVAPGFTVALEGETADTIKTMNKNLRLASKILDGVSRFFGG